MCLAQLEIVWITEFINKFPLSFFFSTIVVLMKTPIDSLKLLSVFFVLFFFCLFFFFSKGSFEQRVSCCLKGGWDERRGSGG